MGTAIIGYQNVFWKPQRIACHPDRAGRLSHQICEFLTGRLTVRVHQATLPNGDHICLVPLVANGGHKVADEHDDLPLTAVASRFVRWYAIPFRHTAWSSLSWQFFKIPHHGMH